MHNWKKWTICFLIMAIFAVFPRAYAAEYTQVGAENISSLASVVDWGEVDITATVLAVLLGISGLGNVLSLVFICKKNKEQKTRQNDNVPLVEYDIDDDII